MSGEITWMRSLVFSKYFLNCFMIVCGFLEVFSVNWRCGMIGYEIDGW